MNIAEAELEDIAQLAELLRQLFAQESDFAPDTEKQCAGLKRIIGSPEIGRILVWREASAVLGMVNLLFTVSTAEGGKVAILEDMVVHPSHRGGGIGGSLLAAAIELCVSEGCSRITLLTDRGNEAAIRFYSRLGFEPSGMIPLRLRLGNGNEIMRVGVAASAGPDSAHEA
jgi:GNAT superfamily N-acetyltransferase